MSSEPLYKSHTTVESSTNPQSAALDMINQSIQLTNAAYGLLDQHSADAHFVYAIKCETKGEEQTRKIIQEEYPDYWHVTDEDMGHYVEDPSTVSPDVLDKMGVFRNLKIRRDDGFKYPLWVELVLSADDVYYVGQTEDVISRVQHHLTSASSPLFTVCNPTGVHKIELCESREESQSREKTLGQELQQIPLSETGTLDIANCTSFAHWA